MSEAKTAEPKKFQAVESPDEHRAFLKEAARASAPVMLWTKDQGHVLHTAFTALSEPEKLFYCATPKEFDSRRFNEDLHQKQTADCFFSLSLPRANLFYSAKFLGSDSAGLRFAVPEKLYKVQRRADFRLPIPVGYVVRVEFPDPLYPDDEEKRYSKKAIDISAGGFSLLVTEAEAAQFTQDMVIEGVEIQLKSRKILCSAEIRHVSVLPPGAQHSGGKLGFRFKEIGASDAQFVAAYVMDESRKYLMTALKEFQG